MSSLVPEKPLVVSPSLAATLGLEEAILLTQLSDMTRHIQSMQRNGYEWYQLHSSQVLQNLPFWNASDCQRILENLRSKGVILMASAPIGESQQLQIAFNDHTRSTHTPEATSPQLPSQPPHTPKRANRIGGNWQPDEATWALLAQQGIDRDFARQNIPEFVQYWRERGESRHSWGNRFLKHVLHNWRQQEQVAARSNGPATEWAPSNTNSHATPIPENWQPSPDVLDILLNQAGMPRGFIEDAVPEFVLYWRENGRASKTWNAQFMNHVKRQWAVYSHAVDNDVAPRALPDNWTPSEDAWEVLALAKISAEFANQCLPEFRLYWRERNEARSSWNTTFLQYVKLRWQQSQRTPAQDASTRSAQLNHELNDNSWAT